MSFKIAFVGGGNTALKFIKFIQKVPEFEIAIVTDISRDAPAMRYASEKHIRISTNNMDAVKFPDINVLIEMTGKNPEVINLIHQNLDEKVTFFDSDQADVLFKIFSNVIDTQFQLLEERFLKNIKDMEKSITDFHNITKNIDILAINASIEAARAGEAGKGFAVVAFNIKDLVKNSRDTLQYVKSVLEKLTHIHKDMKETRTSLKETDDIEDELLDYSHPHADED